MAVEGSDANMENRARYDWNGWTKWTNLETLKLERVCAEPGAYVISASCPINRAVGIDRHGILDIGESDNLRSRLASFARCAKTRGKGGHMAGWRYAFFYFTDHFPFASLRVRSFATPDKAEAYAAEGRVMLAYLKNHRELPPLNYKFNWQEFERQGWNLLDRPVLA